MFPQRAASWGEGCQSPVAPDRRGPVEAFRQEIDYRFSAEDEIQNLHGLTEKAALLDKFYIPTRYPNGLPDLTPGQIYIREDADQGIEAARMFVALAENWLRENRL